MSRHEAKPTRCKPLAWLLEVTESRQPLSETSPIRVRRATITEGPPRPHPDYLGEHCREPIDAGDMVRAVGLSESRLKSLFQHEAGISWVRFLQGSRIHRAAALLNEGRHNVREAAMAVGFDSLSHFNVTFRSFVGVSPKHPGRPHDRSA